MACRQPKPVTLLAGTSLLLSIIVWPVICYNFVLNCMQLMTLSLTLSRPETEAAIESEETTVPPDNFLEFDGGLLSQLALSLTLYASSIISEVILVICLVIQFMSSYDYLTGTGQKESEQSWLRHHKKMVLLTGVVLTIKLTVSLIVINSSAFLLNSLLELYAISLNFIFLVVATHFPLGLSRRGSEDEPIGGPEDSYLGRFRAHQQISALSMPTLHLDLPPSYSELVNVHVNEVDGIHANAKDKAQESTKSESD